MKENKYRLEVHKTTEWIICEIDDLGIRNCVAKFPNETTARRILRLLEGKKEVKVKP